MAKAMGTCRMCGAKFDLCNGMRGVKPENQAFNWRRVCCSLKCGSEFFRRIQESRGLPTHAPDMPEPPPAEAAAE